MYLRILCVAACIVACVSVGPCAPNEDFLKILGAVHKIPSYKLLTSEEKVIMSELLAEAASCQLTVYINAIGYSKILGLIDHLSKGEAHFLSHYMQEHLNWEKNLAAMHPHTHQPTTHHPSTMDTTMDK